MSDPTNHRLYPRAKVVASIYLPDGWPGDNAFLDVWRAGSKRNGYHYGLATFSGSGTFSFLWLTDDERRQVVESLGGTMPTTD